MGSTDFLKAMKIDALSRECYSRGIDCYKKRRSDLESEIKAMFCGLKRPTALGHRCPSDKVELKNVDNYMICSFEKLHDSKGNTMNLFQELPHHVSPRDEKVISDVKTKMLDSITIVRGCDARKALIILASRIWKSSKDEILKELLVAACELTELAYLPASEWGMRKVLRLHNVAHKFAMASTDLVPETKSMAFTTFFGLYWHVWVVHLPTKSRLFPPSSIGAEAEEREFNACKDISSRTSNRHGNHAAMNYCIRSQFERNKNVWSLNSYNSEISKHAKSLPQKKNSIFDLGDIKSRHFLAYLPRISDFLLEGEGKFYQILDDGKVEFFDVSGNDHLFDNIKAMHFRSSNLQDVATYLKECWDKCLASNKIPSHLLDHIDLNTNPFDHIDLNTNPFDHIDLHPNPPDQIETPLEESLTVPNLDAGAPSLLQSEEVPPFETERVSRIDAGTVAYVEAGPVSLLDAEVEVHSGLAGADELVNSNTVLQADNQHQDYSVADGTCDEPVILQGDSSNFPVDFTVLTNKTGPFESTRLDVSRDFSKLDEVESSTSSIHSSPPINSTSFDSIELPSHTYLTSPASTDTAKNCRIASTPQEPKQLQNLSLQNIKCDNTSPREVTQKPESSSSNYSTIGRNILKVTQDPESIKKFERLHRKMKNSSAPHKDLIDDYETELTRVQSNLIRCHTQIKVEIAHIEKQLAFEDIAKEMLNEKEDQELEDSSDIDAHHLESLYERIKLADRILRHWNISVHR